MTTITYYLEHGDDDIELTLTCSFSPAEPDVGIDEPYLESWDFDRIPADCPLTTEELTKLLNTEPHASWIVARAVEAFYDSFEEDDRYARD